MRKNYLLIIALLVVDQVTKFVVSTNMEVGEQIVIIKNFFSIYYVRNYGAAWSLFEGKQWFFYIVTIVTVVFVSRFLYQRENKFDMQAVGITLYIAGALGNFIDRVLFGSVTDFFSIIIPITNYNFPIFNIADMTLICGFVFILISVLKESANERKS